MKISLQQGLLSSCYIETRHVADLGYAWQITLDPLPSLIADIVTC